VLIAHAEDDWDIPDSHSDILFHAFLDPYLPPVDATENSLLNPGSLNKLSEQQKSRKATLDGLIRTTEITKFGRIVEFVAKEQKVVLVKTLVGGHTYLGIQEGLVDIIGKNFGF
jgi:abhydrolase domain-containing protein 12